jgi:CHAT domain-containing protein
MSEANARASLANLGEDARVNLAKAVDLYARARDCFQPSPPDFGRALVNEANARNSLADLGEDAPVNLTKAVELCADAKACFQPGSPDFGNALMNEANARQSLADLGEDARVNLAKAVELYALAKACFQPGSPSFGSALMNAANARASLAGLGEDARVNLAKAVELYADARACFQRGAPSFGRALMNEATARRSLADLGEDAPVNLAKAVELYAEARACFQPGSPDFGRALMYEANARQGLANLGDDARVNLAKALELYAEARACFQPGSPDFGRALMSEANARQSLADLGDDPRVNLQRAADLYGEATACFGLETLDRGTCVRNHAHCLRALARHEPKLAIQHLRSAHRLLREGLGIIEKVRAQMHSEAARIAFLDTMAGQFQTMVLLCLDLAKAFEAKNEEQADAFKATNEEQADAFRAEAWQWVLRSKSRMLLELLSGVRPRLRPEDRPLWDRFQAANRELDLCEASLRQQKLNLGFRGEGLPEPQRNDYRIRLERYDNTRKAVMDQVASYRQLQSVEVPEPKSLVSQLRAKARNGGQGVLLVEYYHAGSEGQILVFLKPLWLDGPPVVVSIETETKVLIETLNGLLRGLALRGMTVRRREGEPEVKNRSRKKAEDSRSIELEDWHAAGKQIEQSMQAMAGWVSPWVEEVERRGWDVQHVVISPHGLLSHVPLHAVPVEGQLLIERWLVSYAPSSAMALQLKAGVQKPGGAALVMGNPQTDNPQDDLPGAEEEAWEVAQVLRQVGVKAQPFVRKDATRGKYVAEGPGKSLAHTACHTVLNPQFERTGLLMADGVLNAAEIVQQVDLKGVLLAYLSSCDSSRAELKRSEELMALVRVMMVAGAGTVMGTLWPLQDQAGKVFAKIFYEEWLVRGRTMPEAYKEAVLRTRAEDRRRDERGCYALGGLYELGAYAWAPFVLMGW